MQTNERTIDMHDMTKRSKEKMLEVLSSWFFPRNCPQRIWAPLRSTRFKVSRNCM